MPSKDTAETRIAILEMQLPNMAAQLVDIKQWLVNSSQQRTLQHTEIVTTLAVIKEKQQKSEDYQKECDQGRAELVERVIECEKTNVSHTRVVGALVILAPIAIGIMEYLKH